MYDGTHPILCGACKRPVKTVPDPEPDSKVVCAGCGQEDRFDKVTATVGEYIVDCTKKAMSEHLSKITRGSRFMQFKPQNTPHRSFRWMIEGEF